MTKPYPGSRVASSDFRAALDPRVGVCLQGKTCREDRR